MVRHLTSRQTARSGSGDLKSLLADELLLCLSRRAGELPQQHTTQARLLVLSIVERSISRGDFRGMRFLTELAGIGEKAEIRREQLRLEKEKAARKAAEDADVQQKGPDLSKALDVYRALQAALDVPPRSRTLDELMQPPSDKPPA